MNRNALILSLVLVVGMVLSVGCGKGDDIDAGDVNELWEEQVILIDTYITGVETAKEEKQAEAAVDSFAQSLEDTVPQFNEWFGKYPAFKEKMEKEQEKKSGLSPETLQKQEAMAKLIAVGLFTENIVEMEVGPFKAGPGVQEARKRLLAVQEKMQFQHAVRTDVKAVEQLSKMVHGQMTGSTNPQVVKFFEKLRRASITSRLKITMRNMYVLGLAIESFKADYSYAPQVKELDQLKSYEDFIPKYIKDEGSLPLEDGWGNYLYYREDGRDYWVGSAGSDGEFRGFAQKGLYSELAGSDLIYHNGRFVYAPQLAAQQPGETE